MICKIFFCVGFLDDPGVARGGGGGGGRGGGRGSKGYKRLLFKAFLSCVGARTRPSAKMPWASYFFFLCGCKGPQGLNRSATRRATIIYHVYM